MLGKQLKILLAGCGDIGQRLGEKLALQHECFGLRRDVKKISGPIIPLQANLTDRPQILSILCLLYTSPSPRDGLLSRMPSSA